MTIAPLVKSVRLSTVLGGDVRLEASTYLRDGYGFVRLANQCDNHKRLGDLTDIWQPSRLTGYTVPEGKGLPFFTAGQVFEDFPRVRKWLSAPFVPQADSRFVNQDWLLLSRSGVVGNVTAVYPHHLNKVITDDLLRIEPKDQDEYGWLYAYMKTDFFKQIARASQYGHMIKHIEVAHANEFPVIMPDAATRKAIGDKAAEAVRLRGEAWKLRDGAFKLLEKEVGIACEAESPAGTCVVSLSKVIDNRSRLDADSYAGSISAVDSLVDVMEYAPLAELVEDVEELPRFKRFYGDSNVPFVGVSEVFDVNTQPTKFVYAKLIKNWERYILKPGTLVMACSGQKYGILGRALLLTENHEGMFGSNHLLRIYPDVTKIRTGYLLAFLNSPTVGRPSVVRCAYGTSVPQLSPIDIKKIRVPRLGADVESAIADLMDRSVSTSAKADQLENEATKLAQEQVDIAIEKVVSNT